MRNTNVENENSFESLAMKSRRIWIFSILALATLISNILLLSLPWNITQDVEEMSSMKPVKKYRNNAVMKFARNSKIVTTPKSGNSVININQTLLKRLRSTLQQHTWELRQNVRDFCGNLSADSFIVKHHKELLANYTDYMYLMRAIDLAYCPIFKSGSSTLLQHFKKILFLDPNLKRPELIPLLQQNLTKEELELKTFALMTITRNPMVRLVSGYTNALTRPAGWKREQPNNPGKLLRDHILKEYRHVNIRTPGFEMMTPTPEEFVHYLIDFVERRGLSELNPHFAPQWFVCPFCTAQFDFIGEISNFREDIAVLAKALNKSKEINVGLKRNTMKRIDREPLFFSNLTREEVKKLFKIFEKDYKMLGIKTNFNKYLDLAHP